MSRGMAELFPLIAIVALVLNICATAAFAGVAKEKGRSDSTLVVWALGIFCGAMIAGIYAAALPDRAGTPAAVSAPKTAEDELPSI